MKKKYSIDLRLLKSAKNILCFLRKKKNDFRDNIKNGYKIYASFSNNLIKWSKPNKIKFSKKATQSWNFKMQAYPHVFKFRNKLIMAYSGNYFGKYGFGLAEIKKYKLVKKS